MSRSSESPSRLPRDANARSSAPPASPVQLSLPRLVALHVVPGALLTLAFVALAPLVRAAGFPPIAALLLAIVLVLLPIELGIVVRAARHDGVDAALPYRRRMSRRDWLWLVPALIVAAFAGFALSMPIEPWLIERLFGWLPKWFIAPISLNNGGGYAAWTWSLTLAALLVLNGFVGPVVEELYFRGYLLPRMERLGNWAPLVNVTLFSLYHLWSPWQVLARILGIGPMVYAVRWKRNIYLGMAVHCSLNSLGALVVAWSIRGLL